MASLFSGLFRRAPKTPEFVPNFPYTWETNPFRCKRTWPPDFTQLSQKHQFRLERRYRRRSQLKWARPNWTKGVKLAQWGSIIFVSIYGVLYLDVGDGSTPFDGVRPHREPCSESQLTLSQIRKAFNEQMGGHAVLPSRETHDNSPTAQERPV